MYASQNLGNRYLEYLYTVNEHKVRHSGLTAEGLKVHKDDLAQEEDLSLIEYSIHNIARGTLRICEKELMMRKGSVVDGLGTFSAK